MEQIGRDFRAYVASYHIPDCTVEQVDEDHITLTTPHARGEVIFYAFEGAPEIVELRIEDADCACEPKFFLHFQLTDESRAKELFGEMASELQQHDLFHTTRVLLCCTAGLTTSMFASKLAEAAKTLSLNYTFEAIPLDQARTEGGSYDVVLLAPQVGYQRDAVAESFPNAVVVEIPAKVFASFDAGSALRLVMHVLSDHTVFPEHDGTNLKLARDLKNDRRIMVVTAINRPRSSWIGWRIYDKGTIVAHGSVTKPTHDLRDVEDLLATLHVRGWNPSDLDAIGIAVPGVINRGTVALAAKHVTDYELGRTLCKRYGTKVFVDNNANAAAVGCYVSQDEYDSVVLHTQQTGFLVGGQGIVVDGHLVKGRKNFAGELTPLYGAIHEPDRSKRDTSVAWTSEGMRKTVAPLLAADIALVAPDAIYVAVDLLDDMDALREEISRYFGSRLDAYIPDLIRVTDYRERIALGELALCLQKLSNPRPHRKH
ncbi:MAG: ROK family protein [Coriobacteriales bacterium]|nr:ROK family protein [Coriobacteriales bacterium]